MTSVFAVIQIACSDDLGFLNQKLVRTYFAKAASSEGNNAVTKLYQTMTHPTSELVRLS